MPDEVPSILTDKVILRALEEDLGLRGDITSRATIPDNATAKAVMRSRAAGALAGISVAARCFSLLAPETKISFNAQDGDRVEAGQSILTVAGPAHSLLAAERTALNFICHLSGIATATNKMVALIEGTGASVCCTRKTTPGLRALEKYAVRMGGGKNHRYRLDDAILIKDNHIAVAGGIRPAVERAFAARGHMTCIEVEIDSPAQLDEILDMPVDAVLFDNMTIDDLKRCVQTAGDRFTTEASGNVRESSIRAIAETGVDMISCGWITHSAPILDLGLDIEIAR